MRILSAAPHSQDVIKVAWSHGTTWWYMLWRCSLLPSLLGLLPGVGLLLEGWLLGILLLGAVLAVDDPVVNDGCHWPNLRGAGDSDSLVNTRVIVLRLCGVEDLGLAAVLVEVVEGSMVLDAVLEEVGVFPVGHDLLGERPIILLRGVQHRLGGTNIVAVLM